MIYTVTRAWRYNWFKKFMAVAVWLWLCVCGQMSAFALLSIVYVCD